MFVFQTEEEKARHYWYNIAKEELEQVKSLTPIVRKAKNVILFLGDGNYSAITHHNT